MQPLPTLPKFLRTFLDITAGWRLAFDQDRTHQRAVRQAIAGLCCGDRHTMTGVILSLGAGGRDWSADYRLHSRSRWRAEELFKPVIERAHPHCGRKYVAVAFDDTKVRKTGTRVPGAGWWADPLGPKFQVQLLWGLRFLQASVLAPEYMRGGSAARGLPVAFTEVPAVKRPRRSAPQEEHAAYRNAVRENNLSTAFGRQVADLRAQLDATGAKRKLLIATVDGSFCNRTSMCIDIDRVVIVARARRDAKLCAPSTEGRRTYDPVKFTPEAVRHDPGILWKTAKVFHGKRERTVRHKEVGPVLWQGGTGPRKVRLIVLAATRYKRRGQNRKRPYYRQAAYLLATDLTTSARVLIQKYFDRWQIEVNHKEEKDTLGVGEAQLRSAQSVPRQPALCVAAYSALVLAAMLAHGPKRTAAYNTLPKWYEGVGRPTARDMVALLRHETSTAIAQTQAIDPLRTLIATQIGHVPRRANVQT